MAAVPETPFPPRSRDAIAAIQRTRLKIAVERARTSRFFKGRLDHIKLDKLDDPAEWQKVPILTKDELRVIPPGEFHDTFCIAPRSASIEYWRSGGSTGRPLFYPRSAQDLYYGMEGFRRLWLSAGCGPGDTALISFPLGIHPVGHLYARTGEELGIGTIWAGAGNSTPSELQIELIQTLKPNVFAGMAGFALQLAQVAERKGIDVSKLTIRKILTAAEPISAAKREKIERLWNAELYDQFGCTEGSAMGSESARHDGMHMWTDLFHIEVVDEISGKPVGVDEPGILVFTPLWNNTITPFLRWASGDIVTWHEPAGDAGPLSLFPAIRHAARTSGFFKVRGVNINHAEFEDLMHRMPEVADFLCEAVWTGTLDALKLSIELRRGADGGAARERLVREVRTRFEITPDIAVIEAGAVERALASQVKPQRIVDRRGA